MNSPPLKHVFPPNSTHTPYTHYPHQHITKHSTLIMLLISLPSISLSSISHCSRPSTDSRTSLSSHDHLLTSTLPYPSPPLPLSFPFSYPSPPSSAPPSFSSLYPSLSSSPSPFPGSPGTYADIAKNIDSTDAHNHTTLQKIGQLSNLTKKHFPRT